MFASPTLLKLSTLIAYGEMMAFPGGFTSLFAFIARRKDMPIAGVALSIMKRARREPEERWRNTCYKMPQNHYKTITGQ